MAKWANGQLTNWPTGELGLNLHVPVRLCN